MSSPDRLQESSRPEHGAQGSSEEKTRRPKGGQGSASGYTRFRQQKVNSWLPILQPHLVVFIFFAIAVVFIPLGNWFSEQSDKVVEYNVKYDDGGGEDKFGCDITESDAKRNCSIVIEVDEHMDPPIYVYYELDNYYQNHRRYVKSRSSAQLLGNEVVTDQFCDPLRNVEINNETFALNPCGLIANSMFNDIIKLVRPPKSYNGSATDGFMSETGISWRSDRETRFKQPPGFVYVQVGSDECPLSSSSCSECFSGDDNYTDCQEYLEESTGNEYKFWYRDDNSVQYLYETYPGIVSPIEGVLNEHFIVWMRTAGIPQFRKIYGRIDDPLYPGDELEFNITANFNVERFSGSKTLVVSTLSLMGAQNPYLGIAYIALGSVSLAIGIAFGVKHWLNPRKLGDTRFMVWKDTML